MHIQREAYKMCIQNTEILPSVVQTNAEQASRPCMQTLRNYDGFVACPYTGGSTW